MGISLYGSADETPQDWGRRNKQYKQFLWWLWESCVGSIFSALDIGATMLPRIWWIGTGIASSMPFHAAGDLVSHSAENTISRAVSSYVPTIRSLLHARARSETVSGPANALRKLLLVTMPTTPEKDNLDGVKEEANAIQLCVGSHFAITRIDKPTVSDVLRRLVSYDIIHFACHGVSHPEDPARSALILQKIDTDSTEAVQDLLTVQQVLETTSRSAQLAFLSACSTAENKVADLADEAMHIASTFFIAGFSHAVGSMWPSDDSVCVWIAERFYASLAEASLQGRSEAFARALHDGVLEVRSGKLREPLLWAQYVHIGP